MKNVIFSLLFCAAVIAAPMVVDKHGYVFISVGEYTIETSLLVLVIGILVLYAVMAVIFKLLGKLFSAHRSIRSFFGRRREESARENLYFGLIALLEHRYEEAQHLLISCTHSRHRSVASYIIAAEAAAKNGDEESCLESLKNARMLEPRSDLACILLESGLYARSGKYEKAIDVLEQAVKVYPLHPAVYRSLGDLCLICKDYDRMRSILPQIRNIRNYQYEDYLRILVTLYRYDLDQTDDADRILSMWNEVARSIRKEPAVRGLFARRLACVGRIREAEEILEEGFRKSDVDSMLEEVAACDVALPSIRNYLVLLECSAEKNKCSQDKLYRALANQFLAACDYPSSIERFRKAIAISPQNEDYVKISKCYEAERLFEKTDSTLNRAEG
jgi:HemY protein